MILTEILVPVVLHQYLYKVRGKKFFLLFLIHIILSMWLWVLFFTSALNDSFFDNPRHIWTMMNLTGMIVAVVAPRSLIVILHYSGRLLRIRKGGYLRWLTGTGLVVATVMFFIIAVATLYSRFNFKTEEVTVKIKGLNKDLDGIRIVQLSDLHLASFYHHMKVLEKVTDKINSFNPDLILNTGDFVTFGWREFGRNDTILSRMKSRYGNFAVLGNHDSGGYNPTFTEADRNNNVLIMNNLIRSSGYKVLNNEFTIVRIGSAKVGLIGVTTMGRHPNIIHGDLNLATSGLDSADIKIFLSHDPNHWEEAVKLKTDINLTLSGHTHGMQMGILTKNFKWSPSKYFYPHWSGLYSYKDQFLYVNRGLGLLAVPFRIWMPPEITIITLKRE
jgi:uncharacterized protein